jgi:hypothetical protein
LHVALPEAIEDASDVIEREAFGAAADHPGGGKIEQFP